MAPHNDAPLSSSDSSYAAGFIKKIPFGSSTSALKHGSVTPAETSLSGSLNGTTLDAVHVARPLVPGVYVPTLCFFDSDENVDTAAIAQHAVRLARAGVTGLATQGSNGEAVHLTNAERHLVTATTRDALNRAGFPQMPIIVGCGAQSTRETIELCNDAWHAGGDYALVLPPSYYSSLFAPSSETIVDFFHGVADASPIPLIIYNYPGAVNGLDLSSDVIIKLAAHPNIVGVKLTCGNTGKLNRVATATRKMAKAYDPKKPEFLVLAGSADFTIPSLAAGGHGILAGLANIAPKACIRTMGLYHQGKQAEAEGIQDIVSQGDWTAIQGGVVGVKAGLQAHLGYGGYARHPLPKPTAEHAQKIKEGFADLVLLENTL